MAEFIKCARCKHALPVDGFGINRKQERSKTCKACNEQKVKWAKKKRDTTYDLNPEQWKEHPVYAGYYASKSGGVVNGKTKKPIGVVKASGCIELSLRVPTTLTMLAHRFVYEAFNGAIPDGMYVRHINEVKDDNRIENLEIVSKSDSMKRSSKMTGRQKRPAKPCIGHMEGDDKEIAFKSSGEAQRITGCHNKLILDVCNGIMNTTTSKTDGSKWVFRYA